MSYISTTKGKDGMLSKKKILCFNFIVFKSVE